ncbi:unnamed protein product [Strongylus vulgaris]|uniref:RNA-binding S4 domain-containing protein n=1 Tax=Strongylus vulgaris TaxID=40348 RepID=A0A3P7JIN3_STRVU|nr:unnamed protein product [Strongylus vulgaris]
MYIKHASRDYNSLFFKVEQGHVRIGPKLVTDPAFIVTRTQEDAITWTNASKIKQYVLDYNNVRDDFDLA